MQRQGFALLLALTVALASCETTHWKPTAKSEFSARSAADVQLSEPLTLFDFHPRGMVGLISGDGHAHVIANDHKDGAYHAEVDDKGVVRTERMGVAPNADRDMLDVVEYPARTLRALAGESQFIRDPMTVNWQEFKGNRCTRFAKAGGHLYCGFVVSGEEFGSPARTDVYGGVFIIFPFVLPIPRQSEKLVLAELVDTTWIARFVIDAEDELDAGRRFLMDADREGNIHVLYGAGRGGVVVLLNTVSEPVYKARYLLIERAVLEQAAKESNDTASRAFVGLNGSDVVLSGLFQYTDNDFSATLFPTGCFLTFCGLSSGALNPVSGAFEDLVKGLGRVRGLFGVQVIGGVANEQLSLVVPEHWPTDTYYYGLLPAVVKIDSDGAFHAIQLTLTDHSYWWGGTEQVLSYFVRHDRSWSLPITFPVSIDVGLFNTDTRQLLAVGTGRAFVAWSQNGAGLQGRWIYSRESKRQ